MKKQPKHKQAVRFFHFWCGKAGVKKPIIALRDNRMDTHFCVDASEDGSVIFKYHPRRLGSRPKCVWVGDVFHEIGHIKNNLPYETDEEKIESEYRAEKFSIKMMKKHYPSLYKKLIKRLIKRQKLFKYTGKEDIYYKAFIRIKEYRDTIR